MFGLKVIGKWIDFGHNNTSYKLNFGWLKFGKSLTTRQIRPTFSLPNIPAIRYVIVTAINDVV